ncbi:hypothetical protein LCGC14_0365210 [marine sediment metagenome]|uniref:Uncharacterized protein n=1 Tax=marine sediment metagenome TaxID=412755 RepID=A0A0F9T6M9_9ZZZZ
MTPDKWADKDRITRRSIERQTAAKIAFEFARDDEEVRITLDHAELIYQWISGQPSEPSPKATEKAGSTPFGSALSKPPATGVTATKPSPAEEGKVVVDRNLGAIKSLPQFHKAVFDDFRLQPEESLKLLEKKQWSEDGTSFTLVQYKAWSDVGDTFEECYLTIMRKAMEPEPENSLL